jgi:squid-like protein
MAEVDFTQDTNGDFGENGAKSNGNAEAAKDEKPSDDRKIFVGGLSWETRDAQLKEYFEKFGEVETVNLKLNPQTGRSRCFAFVIFKEPATVQAVFAAGDHAINSKKVDVKQAKAKPGKMFLGGLKPELTDDQIKAHFEQYGAILEFEMPFDKTKDARKGFGFITFEKEETMKDLIKKGKETIGEHEIDLKKATPRADNFFGQQGGGGGGWGDNYGYDYSWAGGYGGGDMYGGGGWGQQPMGYGGWGPYGGGARGGGKMQRGRGRGRGRGGPY